MYIGNILKSKGKVANVYLLLLLFEGFFCFVYAVYADVYAVTVKFYILESLHAV